MTAFTYRIHCSINPRPHSSSCSQPMIEHVEVIEMQDFCSTWDPPNMQSPSRTPHRFDWHFLVASFKTFHTQSFLLSPRFPLPDVRPMSWSKGSSCLILLSLYFISGMFPPKKLLYLSNTIVVCASSMPFSLHI